MFKIEFRYSIVVKKDKDAKNVNSEICTPKNMSTLDLKSNQ